MLRDRKPDLPLIAVVVIGRNEGERLRRCLESVRSMDYPQTLLRLIYVDSHSSDGSLEIARSFGAVVVPLEGATTAARGRNAGWTLVETPFVLFLDGDTVLDPKFVRAALVPFRDPWMAGVGGNRREIDPEGSLYNAVLDMDWRTPSGPKPNIGGDALVRLDALRAVAGFNANLIAGEEPEMCRRLRVLGYKFFHIDVPMTLHDMGMHTFQQYWRRALRTGHAYAEVSSIYARTSDPLWLEESKRNVERGLFWILLPFGGLAGSILFRSFVPGILALMLGALVIGRTIKMNLDKTPVWKERLGYGLHSHLQQIPILVGQVRYWRSQRGRQKGELTEYKTS